MNINDSITINGPTELIIPEYMEVLPENVIQKIFLEQKKNVILTCGFNKKDNSITCVTESLQLIELNVEKFFKKDIGVLSAIPIKNGDRIEVKTPHAFVEVDAEDIISSGTSIDMSQMQIDMSHANQIK